MKMKNRYLSLVLAMVMVFTMLPFSCFWASAVNVPTISLKSDGEIAAVGDIITVIVETTPDSKIVSFGGKINYNTDYFAVVDDKDAYANGEVGEFPDGMMGMLNIKTAGEVKFAIAGSYPLEDSITTVFLFKFKVLKVDGTIDMNISELYVSDGASDINLTSSYKKVIYSLTIGCKHTYTITDSTDVSCTTDGTKKFVCSQCGYEYTETITATGHNYESIVTYPTCEDKGFTIYTCSVCDDTYTEETPELGHDWDGGVLTRPGEAGNGYYTYTCKRDGTHTRIEDAGRADYTEFDTAYNKILGYINNPYITNEGKTEILQLIQNYASSNPNMDANGNLRKDLIASEQAIVDEATTAAKDILTLIEGQITRCGNGSHDVRNFVPYTVATCTENGTKKGTCFYCGAEIIEEDKNAPALGHNIVIDEAKAPTCTEIGWYAYEYCTECDYTTYVERPAKGHVCVNVSAKAPTCTSIGWKAYEYCTVCEYTTYNEISATGHTLLTVEAKAPTCTEIGYDAYEYCSVCDYTTYKEIPATGHSYKTVVTAPTCVEEGYTTYTCNCGDTYVTDKISATGHTPDDAVVENTSDATCGTPGSYDEVIYCTVCDSEISRETKTTDTLPHAYKSKVTTAPTCTETGVKTITCSVCGDEYTEEVSATGHTLVNVDAKAPTCTEVGYDAYEYCTVCEYTTYIKKAATGHTIVNVDAKAPTCTEVGYDAYEYCSVCDYTTYKEISATGHSYETEVTAPTCTEKGYTTYTCSCNDSYVDNYVDAIGHSFKEGECTECGAVDPDYFTFEIDTPSTTKIKCRNGIILHAKVDGNFPEDATIKWTADNENFNLIESVDGKSVTLISKNKGYTVITATVYDAEEQVITQDTVEMYSDAGLLQKIVGFFRVIFGMDKILEK